MRIADKILQFDNTMPANVKQFEELFQIKLDKEYNENYLVEILEPFTAGFRRVLINGEQVIVDLNPRIDGRSKADVYSGGRKFYKYTATNPQGKLLAEGYSISELAEKLDISKDTVMSIIKRKNELLDNTGGRQRKQILIKREELEKKEDRKLVTKNKKRYYYVVMKEGKEVAKFKGAKKAAKFLGVSEASVINYASGRFKNRQGYKVVKREVE